MNDGMIGEEINDTEDNEEIAAEENDSVAFFNKFS